MLLDRTMCHLMTLGLILLSFQHAEINAQSALQTKRLARIFYQENQLAEAHPYFIKSIENGKNSCSWLMKASESCLAVNDLDNAFQYLHEIIEKKGDKKVSAYKLMGIALQRAHKFEEAIISYKKYLKKSSQKENDRQAVKYFILQCRNGIKLEVNKFNQEVVSNLGSNINDGYNQFGLIQSATNENKYYFTGTYSDNEGGKRDRKGKPNSKYGSYKSDIFKIINTQGKWSDPARINDYLNTSIHDVLLSLGHEGQSLLYYNGSNFDNGKVYVDSFEVNATTSSNQVLTNQFTIALDARNGLYLYRDSILFYSSNQEGGYGGFDIYMSINKNGRWLKPANLGPLVNSPFDEITPYMSYDGRNLYFSSNSTKSMGGYDIFRIKLDDANLIWDNPTNLGIPINSASDDTHYQGNMDGFGGTFSSNRPEGFGQFDLYNIYYEQLHKEELILKNTNIFSDLYNSIEDIDPNSVDIESYANKSKQLGINTNSKQKIVLEQIINTQQDYMSSSKNRNYFDKISQILRDNPKVKIRISSYIDGSGNEYQLIFSSKTRADKVRQYLNENGVDNSQIITIGYGNAQSIIKQEFEDASLVKLQHQLNNRLDFDIIDPINSLVIQKRQLDIPKKLMSDRVFGSKGLNYKIRLIKSNQILANPLISKANKAILMQDGSDNNSYYYISKYETFDKANYGISLINQSQFKDPKVVPFMGDHIINRQQIVDYSILFPDLTKYLKYNP